jgi:predicted amidohydrolase YtcJ
LTDLLIRGAEVEGRTTDVLVADGRITRMTSAAGTPAGATVIEAGGGALVPGLHDHHVHVLAMAARETSVDLGPASVRRPEDLDRELAVRHRELPAGRWLRAVGYDEHAGGPLERRRLDRLAPGRPVRVQHRSGAMWVLSSPALDRLPRVGLPEGVERDDYGQPTGRLWRLDDWLRRHTWGTADLDLAAVGATFVRRGVTGVTDATPSTDTGDFATLAAGVRRGDLPLRITVTGSPELAGAAAPPPLVRGPVKIVVADHQPPPVEVVAEGIARAHRHGRPVAVHCVTAVAAAITIAAWEHAGAVPGDRMEHGSVLDPAAVERLAELGVTVVTQPAFVRDHGDRYRRDVDPGEAAHLYRCRSLLDAGVPVGGSSDAPFGDPDPWLAMSTAITRETAGGASLLPAESIDARQALDLYLTPAEDPGGRPRRLVVGAPADLCLLRRPLAATLRDPAAAEVALTVVAGRVVHTGEP